MTVTLSGSPAFSGAYAIAQSLAMIELGASTFSGSASGARYVVVRNAVLSVSGGGASYLPGSTAGSAGTGGYYG